MSRKPTKPQHGSTTKQRRNNAPTAARPTSSTLADLQEQLKRQTRKLEEAGGARRGAVRHLELGRRTEACLQRGTGKRSKPMRGQVRRAVSL